MKKSIIVPSAGESVTEGEILSFLVPQGEYAKEGDAIVEVETDKATAEVYAPASGTVAYTVKEGDTVTPGQEIGTVDTEGAAAPAPETPKEPPKPTQEAPPVPPPQETKPTPPPAPTHAPLRISQEEALAKRPEPGVFESSPTPVKEGKGGERREKMTKLRRTIAHRLVESKNTTAMLTTFNEVDMSAVMNIRKKHKETFEKKFGARLGFMSFFVKASCVALKEFPSVNAFIDGDEVVYHDFANVGIAVGTDRGLVVPVIKNADKKTFAEIELAIVDFAGKARNGKLKMQDMSEGTFTISNGGTYGSLLSTPILNPPQSGILGMHAIKERPIAIDGKVEIRPMMYLALSYDHRIVDGEGSIKFLVKLKECLENPEEFFIME